MKALSIGIFIMLMVINGFSQETGDFFSDLQEESVEVQATFKSTRIVNGQSVECRKKGSLEFLISHRFGRLNSGAYEFFGLDQSNIRLGLEYAIFDNLSISLGRSSFEKTYDAYFKFKFLHQRTGVKSFPVSAVLFSSISARTLKSSPDSKASKSINKLSYVTQVLIARKINQSLSIQLTPTYIHYNLVEENEENNKYAVGIGSRIKLSKRTSVNLEYYYTINPFTSQNTYNSIGLGFDIETGGHVFQLVFTNSIAMIEKSFITETTGNILNGDIHFGFNISRTF